MKWAVVGQKDIAEMVAFSRDFSIFAAALNATELFEILKTGGPYTVFAPCDAAFDSLPVGTLDYLFKPENKPILVCIVKYHVVRGRVTAEDTVGCCELKTLGGEMLSVASRYGQIIVDRATIMRENIECSNGIIHTIDMVVVPKRWL